MARFIDLALSAVMLAGLYATMAYGLGLIYGVLRIVNLAHGTFITTAGLSAGLARSRLSHSSLSQ